MPEPTSPALANAAAMAALSAVLTIKLHAEAGDRRLALRALDTSLDRLATLEPLLHRMPR